MVLSTIISFAGDSSEQALCCLRIKLLLTNPMQQSNEYPGDVALYTFVQLMRAFGHNDGFGTTMPVRTPIQPVPGIFNETALRRYDFVMDALAKVCLQSSRPLTPQKWPLPAALASDSRNDPITPGDSGSSGYWETPKLLNSDYRTIIYVACP